jgi:hypothetical protein
MVLMMNKNFLAFLTFVLRDLHFPEPAIQEYVKRCCCQVKAAEIGECKWESDTATLTTPQDLKKKATDNFTLVSWYKDAFADLGIGEKGKRNLPPPPENLFKLDEERSVFTIHKRNEPRHLQDGEDSLATTQQEDRGETVDLTGHQEPRETIVMAESDEDSASLSSNGSVLQSTAATGEDNQMSSLPSSEEVTGSAVIAADAE